MSQIAQQEKDIRRIVNRVRQLGEGRSLAAGTVTLRASQTTTTVTNSIISAGCFPQLMPTSATAATAVGGGNIYVSSVASGSFVITHNSTADLDRTFNWHAPGG